MAGTFFVVCIPRAEYEKELKPNHEERSHHKRRNSDEDLANKKTTEHPNIAKSMSDSYIASYDFVDAQETGSKNVNNARIDNSMQSYDGTPLETILNELLERLHVKDAVWCLGKEKKYYQVLFSIESGEECEEVIQLLGSFGIGTRCNSAVSVIPCALYYRANKETPVGTAAQHDRPQSSAWSRFVSTVRARTTLAQLLQDVRADATLTFDWLFLLIVAAFLSAIGLVENSTVFLVASMLISPLMGPIMACAVGTAVRDYSLQRMGFIHELFGLFLALVIGFLFGLVLCAIGDNYGGEVWPTYEMISRCEVRSLWVGGVLIALPSAAAVALAVLGGYTASLVGVAISASLLPPAVNAGLLWSLAVTSLVSDTTGRWDAANRTFYSDDLSTELAIHGSVSLCLTIVNILCIYVGGVIVYKIKEVAPIDPKNMKFWQSEGRMSSSSSSEERIASGGNNILSPSTFANWDYFGRRYDRMALPRPPYDRRHETWSPYSVDINTLPRARDIEFCCQQRESSPYSRSGNRPSLASLVSDIRGHGSETRGHGSDTRGHGYRRLPSDNSVSHNADPNTSGQDVVDQTNKTTSANKILKDPKIVKTKFTVTPVCFMNQ